MVKNAPHRIRWSPKMGMRNLFSALWIPNDNEYMWSIWLFPNILVLLTPEALRGYTSLLLWNHMWPRDLFNQWCVYDHAKQLCPRWFSLHQPTPSNKDNVEQSPQLTYENREKWTSNKCVIFKYFMGFW